MPLVGQSDWTYLKLEEDFAAPMPMTDVPISAEGGTVSFTPDPASDYEVEAVLFATASSLSDMPGAGFAWGSGYAGGGANWRTPSQGFEALNYGTIGATAGNLSLVSQNGLPELTVTFFGSARLRAGAVPTPFRLQFQSLIGTPITLRAGSFIRYRRLLSA